MLDGNSFMFGYWLGLLAGWLFHWYLKRRTTIVNELHDLKNKGEMKNDEI